MDSSKEIIRLQEWWIDILRKITEKEIRKEEAREAKALEKSEEELADYASIEQINDAAGWGFISTRKRNHLIALWNRREQEASQPELYRMKLELLSELTQTARRIIEDHKILMGGGSDGKAP